MCVCVLGGGGVVGVRGGCTLLQDYSSNVIVLVCVDSLSSLQTWQCLVCHWRRLCREVSWVLTALSYPLYSESLLTS